MTDVKPRSYQKEGYKALTGEDLPQEILDMEMVAPAANLKKEHLQGRIYEAAEYDPRTGKLLPLHRWRGVSIRAKKMAKRLARAGQAQEVTAIAEGEVGSAFGAWLSRTKRASEIRTHNRRVRAHVHELKLGNTKEQRQARKDYDLVRVQTEQKPLTKVSQYEPKQGGPYIATIPVVKNEGYIGVELRAIRREETLEALNGRSTNVKEW